MADAAAAQEGAGCCARTGPGQASWVPGLQGSAARGRQPHSTYWDCQLDMMCPIDLEVLPQSCRFPEMKHLLSTCSRAENNIPPGGDSHGHAGTMSPAPLHNICNFISWVFGALQQPVRLYDIGAGSGNVLLVGTMVYGWQSFGCELSALGADKASRAMQVVCTKLQQPKADASQVTRLLASKAQVVLQRGLPTVDVLCVEQGTKDILLARLRQLGVNVLYVFWAAWSEVDKQAVLEVFCSTPGVKMLAASDHSQNRELYEQPDDELHRCSYVHATGHPKMAGGGSAFRTWIFTKRDVPFTSATTG